MKFSHTLFIPTKTGCLIGFLVVCLGFFSAGAQAQAGQESLRLQWQLVDKARPKYLVTGYTLGYNKLRDTGTSPRFFEGNNIGLTLGFEELDSLKKFRFAMEAGFARLTDNGIPEQFLWSGPMFHLQWSQQWMLRKFADRKVQLGLGASVNSVMFFRSNDAFFNAGFGLDNINTLGLSAGLYFPFERMKAKTIDLWLFQWKLNPRKYQLAFTLDLPVATLSTRPEYAYLTNVVDPETITIDTYTFQWGGYQINTNLDFTYYLYNGNAFRLNYQWLALQTSDIFELSMARHRFSVSYLMRLNRINTNERY